MLPLTPPGPELPTSHARHSDFWIPTRDTYMQQSPLCDYKNILLNYNLKMKFIVK
jgi:hypothetical protein